VTVCACGPRKCTFSLLDFRCSVTSDASKLPVLLKSKIWPRIFDIKNQTGFHQKRVLD
jgi:hypothetical protein